MSGQEVSFEHQKLPLWRLISGIAVLASLLAVAAALAPIYLADYRFTQYVRALPAQPDTAGLSDDVLKTRIVGKAGELSLPLQTSDVVVRRSGSKVQIQVARIKAQVWRADLHFSAIATK